MVRPELAVPAVKLIFLQPAETIPAGLGIATAPAAVATPLVARIKKWTVYAERIVAQTFILPLQICVTPALPVPLLLQGGQIRDGLGHVMV